MNIIDFSHEKWWIFCYVKLQRVNVIPQDPRAMFGYIFPVSRLQKKDTGGISTLVSSWEGNKRMIIIILKEE